MAARRRLAGGPHRRDQHLRGRAECTGVPRHRRDGIRCGARHRLRHPVRATAADRGAGRVRSCELVRPARQTRRHRAREPAASQVPGSHYGIDRTCGTDPLPTSEHYDGRAIDWFRSVRSPAQRADATAVLRWLFAKDAAGHAYANARRLGVMYLIWNNRIWGSYRASDGWRPYSNCATRPAPAYDTTCHRDHIHFSLSWEGAMKRTSFWTHEVAARDYGPCRVSDMNWAAPYRAVRGTSCPSYSRVSAPAGASSLLGP